MLSGSALPNPALCTSKIVHRAENKRSQIRPGDHTPEEAMGHGCPWRCGTCGGSAVEGCHDGPLIGEISVDHSNTGWA